MDLSRLEQILDRARSRRITVIGDLMLVEFVWGKVGRISPEAPVPVVEVTGESFYPGGAANVARNLRELVDQVAIIGLFGKDHTGQQLRKLLAEQKIDSTCQANRLHHSRNADHSVTNRSFVSIASGSPPSNAQVQRVVAAVRQIFRHRCDHFRRLR
jgi:bifunctional ADP-heptose synthase (sugar kinase/adenylyltransferase)